MKSISSEYVLRYDPTYSWTMKANDLVVSEHWFHHLRYGTLWLESGIASFAYSTHYHLVIIIIRTNLKEFNI